ncbi:hypothetical protein NCCP2495_30560 [Dietzia sp. NCCP-2495]|uniref:SMP-30/gluconolactonase/LRE family protein n=1 Tax=Dietzia sp. NCCP-2495 TaxID=2934675 RepID=UPI00222EB277|nr:hypothetical protein [Dietzia sp. NCCP-2495]GLB65176.1 hypothetical protein NCCP2495_30560 [Dietzia sp. NCCP-2495]
MQPLRRVTAALAVVVPVLALTTTSGAAAADPLGSAVVGAATSLGAVGAPVSGSVEAVPSGSHAGSVAALDAGSDAAFGLGASSDSAGAPIGACEGPAPHVTTFGATPPPVLGWTENMAFDAAGRLWVSKTFLDRVDAYDDDGEVIASVDVRAPGGIALGPDGRMHVAAGTGYLADRSDLITFDPAAEQPEARVEARLGSRKNGLAVDADGNRYLTGLQDTTLTKVGPDGEVDREWSQAAAIGVSNGIAIDGDTAYVTQPTDRAVVHAVPLDRPGEWTTTELTAPPTTPRGLDDLDITAEALYVTSWSSGEVYRIDRASGEACVLVGGIPRATSVLVADGFGDFGSGDLLVTSLHGPIRHVARE